MNYEALIGQLAFNAGKESPGLLRRIGEDFIRQTVKEALFYFRIAPDIMRRRLSPEITAAVESENLLSLGDGITDHLFETAIRLAQKTHPPDEVKDFAEVAAKLFPDRKQEALFLKTLLSKREESAPAFSFRTGELLPLTTC